MGRPVEGDVREVIGLVRLCEKLRTLPEPGGLLEQDSYLMYLFQEVFNADSEAAEKEHAKARAEQDRIRAQAQQAKR